MPKKQGAPARASKSSAARPAKKPRWNSTQRVANGLSAERPRGGQNAERGEAPRSGADRRPNWEPRGRAGSAAGTGAGRNDRYSRGDSTERPSRFANGERRERSDRGDWSPRGERSERPNRFERGDRTDRVERNDRFERGPRADRFERGDRAGRFDRSDRFERSDRADRAERGDRFERSERNDRSDRAPRAERPARSEWAPRSERSERPARADRSEWTPRAERGERPARAERSEWTPRPDRANRSDRALRSDWNDRAPRRHDDERPARAPRDRDVTRPTSRPDWRPAARDEERTERFVPAPDVVHERLEATAIETAETTEEQPGFAELGLGQNIVRALADLGAASPFPIQSGTIPAALEGRDVLGRGRTGSGKTIAFGAPLVERLLRLQKEDTERRRPGRPPRALILAPTRELALQIDATVQPLAQSVRLFTTQIYGGVPFNRQIGALQRGVDIVIGTPGRIQDLARRGELDLSAVEITVLDEADHMAELGFIEPVQELLRMTRAGGQRLLFSATLDTAVMGLIEEFLVEPAVFEVAGEDQASSTIDHRVLVIDHRDKLEILTELVDAAERTIVFSRTRAYAEQLADHLDDQGINADAIHGDLAQARRQRALDRFSRGRTAALVATDVAARGIHVDDVDLVIQADAPDEHKSYLHRSGRTGRAGRSGVVVTLVPRNRRRRMEDLLSRANITAEWIPVRPGEAAAAIAVSEED